MTLDGLSKFDLIYRRLLITKFFTKGWGSPESMRRLLEFRKILSCRKTCMSLVDENHPVHIDKSYDSSDCRIMEGHFLSPFAIHHPEIMPDVAKTARFQLVIPLKWTSQYKPVCIHLAGTGDHGFWRRRVWMARPLVKEAQIGSIILENPYYGCRKPKDQLRSSLQNVSDLFVMGGSLVLESIALLNWCKRMGFGPLGITGVSMGGHMASAAACSWPHPLSIIPCLSWSTASLCFTQMASLAASSWSEPLTFVPCLSWSTASMVWTQGVLSGAVSWSQLEEQYRKDTQLYEEQLSPLIHSPEQHRWNDLFKMGQKFAKNYPESVDEMERIQKQEIDKQQVVAGSFYTSMMNSISSRITDPQLVKSRERLKQLHLHSPNLPNKPISAQVIHFMRGVMDECTHLAHFSAPVDPSLIIAVTAKQDAYMPRDRVISLPDIWPGCEIRYVDRGHVTAILFNQNVFRKAIIDSFNRQIAKYYTNTDTLPDKARNKGSDS